MIDEEKRRPFCELCFVRKAQNRCTICHKLICDKCILSQKSVAIGKDADDNSIDSFLDSISIHCKKCGSGDR